MWRVTACLHLTAGSSRWPWRSGGGSSTLRLTSPDIRCNRLMSLEVQGSDRNPTFLYPVLMYLFPRKRFCLSRRLWCPISLDVLVCSIAEVKRSQVEMSRGVGQENASGIRRGGEAAASGSHRTRNRIRPYSHLAEAAGLLPAALPWDGRVSEESCMETSPRGWKFCRQ